MPVLSARTLGDVAPGTLLGSYDRPALRPGIVHLGLGAFHRAHQAVYTENALNLSGGDWGIIAVAMRSDTLARQLQPQDLLYSVLSEDAGQRQLQVVGALTEVIVAPRQPQRLFAALADPSIQVVTLTVTEKGYCLAGDGQSLDVDNAQVAHDLAHPDAPQTAPGILAQGLRQRFAAGGAPLTVISCDNLGENSARLRALVRALLERTTPQLLPWFERAVSFPNSMVDRIVPAMTEAGRERQANLLGLQDAAAIATESFSQWIIEDKFAAGRPDWGAVGVQFVDDIRPYESLKLGLLNASHSAIAYLGLLAGKESVAEVMADPLLGGFVLRLMNESLIPALDVPAGFDVAAYRDALLARFANPHLRHRCAQIAMDGSEKIRQRWLPALRRLPGSDCLLQALAGWAYYVLCTPLELEDPRSQQLLALRHSAADNDERLAGLLHCLFAGGERGGDDAVLRALLSEKLDRMASGGLPALLRA